MAKPVPAAEPYVAPVATHTDNSATMLGRSEPGIADAAAAKHPSGISPTKKPEAKKVATGQVKSKPKPKRVAKPVVKPVVKQKPKLTKPKPPTAADGANS